MIKLWSEKMSQGLIIVIGIILFALATIVLYFIGLRKKMGEEKRLNDMLLNNGARRVIKYLKIHETVTADEIGYIVRDVKASEFYSKKTAVISDGRAFQDQLIAFMLEGGYICKKKVKGRLVYVLPEDDK